MAAMKTDDDLSYHEARAEEELARAESATSAGAVRAHVALAEMHLDIVYNPQTGHDAGKATPDVG
jgi:hypothetical protein